MHTRSYYFMHNQKQVHEHVEHNYSMQILQHAPCLKCQHERCFNTCNTNIDELLVLDAAHQLTGTGNQHCYIGEANVRPLPVFQASPRVAQSEICPGEASGTTESFKTNTQFSRKELDQEHCSTCTVVALQVAGHVDRQSWTT